MKRLIILSILFSTMLVSCRYTTGKRISGNGNIKTETRTTGQFHGIAVRGSFQVYIKQDSVISVSIEGDENLLEYVHLKTDDGILEIKKERGFNLSSSKGIKVFVSAPLFKHLKASGASDIISENKITNTESIEIDLSGACNIKLELMAPEVKADLSGACNITLWGQTKNFKVEGSGSTDIKCFDLMTENTTVELSGAGYAEVFASIKLDVKVSGAADVKYKGNATVSQKISGAGSVKKVDAPVP